MKKITIGQIGIGHNHAAGKMNAVRRFPDIFEIVGVAEPNGEWRKERGGMEVYKGLEFMSADTLISKKPDAVLVETDVWDLVGTARTCIDAGIHIHMDKPAGENIADYKEVLLKAKAKSMIVQLGYMYRYNPAIKQCLTAVRTGELGEIFAINAEMSTHHSPQYREWLTHFKGGSMYIFGCHLIDLIVQLLGKPETVVPFNKRTGLDGVETYDNCFAALDYPGATCKVTAASVEINGWGRRQFVVCGSKGTYEIKPLELPTVMTRSLASDVTNDYADCKEAVPVPETERDHRYDEMILDLARMIRGEKENPFTYEHELSVQETLLAACGFGTV